MGAVAATRGASGEEASSVGSVVVAHPSSELYGSDRVAAESAAALVAAGSTVRVTLGGDGPLRALMESAGAPVSTLEVPVLRKSALSPRGLVRLARDLATAVPGMWRLLREVRPDVVYVSTVTVPWWLVLGRLAGAQVVCHVHEAEEGVPRPVRLALAAPLLLAHRVVANSERSRDVLVRELPLLRNRTEVVYNGVPGPEAVTPPRVELSGPVRLVLVGRVSPRKGTDVAVRALARLVDGGTDATLDLVGDVFPGYEWFSDEVHATARELGVADRVRWRGVQPDVWGAFAAADVALVPSRVEPFGNAAVESMLAQRPVVAGDTQGLREIVRPGENGELAAPGDPAALADAVERVLHDWDGAAARAVAARAEAVRRYSPQRYREKIVSVLTGADRP